ncbi:hydroxymethylbilane synthase [Streptomyces tsukubensis]|uniref:hydroxymethylbilane synthase n=1 Tax=Streptomyces tsukubensis TaxID=83656 RepID=UPI0015C3633D|nr:hydroxymethylbilane synthase [Streptomyces tsukubensis]
MASDHEGAARAGLDADGAHTAEIEASLLAGRIDLAVHCLKVTPTVDTEGLALAAFRARGDVRDALVHPDRAMTVVTLTAGSRMGTASVRRRAQLATLRPDVVTIPLRGPADDRLGALDAGAVDALILAASGLDRLGLAHRISEHITTELVCPPLGAAIIALQCRADDEATIAVAAGMGDETTTLRARAERAVLRDLGGFGNAPLAGYCILDESGLTLRAMVFSPDGLTRVDVRRTGPDPESTALAVCRVLREHGAGKLKTFTIRPPSDTRARPLSRTVRSPRRWRL